MVFDDRSQAGAMLAERLGHLATESPVVLALPRGGVEVGYEVARTLGAPLDVIVARKIGAPGRPELGIGAVAPGGVKVLDQFAVRYLGVTEQEIDRMASTETAEMERRLRAYRGNRPSLELKDRTVIVVDDGLATGVTARAAVQSIQLQNPRKVVLAIPVCAAETAESMRGEVDEIVCVQMPDDVRAVGLWYQDFRQLEDDEVVALLEAANRPPAGVR